MAIRYRAFRNTDPPALAEIWRQQPPAHGRMQPMSPALLEQFIFAKPYFDRQGLIVAVDGELPVGFAHAAFGPSDDEQRLSTDLGLTCLVMVRADYRGRAIGTGLLTECEAYLRRRGARVLYAGGIAPLNGFYLGLYGGSELPGLLDSDVAGQRLFRSRGYREIDRVAVLERELAGFRAPIDRVQMQIRRCSSLEALIDPPARTWWEACVWGAADRVRYELTMRDAGRVAARATFWPILPLSTSWGVQACGVTELEVDEGCRRRGLALFLLGEAFRQFQAQGVKLVQAQTMRGNTSALKLYEKLGFQQIEEGRVLRKDEMANASGSHER
jgi:ribosomal protein S18 acetylase RimI-like enzyme